VDEGLSYKLFFLLLKNNQNRGTAIPTMTTIETTEAIVAAETFSG
jgi:hypothetical protein